MNSIWVLTVEFYEAETEVYADVNKNALLKLFNDLKEDDRKARIKSYGEGKTLDEAEEGDAVINESVHYYSSYELGDYNTTYCNITLQELVPYSQTKTAELRGHVTKGGE